MKKKTIITTAVITVLLLASLVAAASHYDSFKRVIRKDTSYSFDLVYKDADGPDGIPGNYDDWTKEKNKDYGNGRIFLRGLINHQVVSYDGVFLHGRVYGLKPYTEYQIKLNSYGAGFEAEALANACDEPETGAIWQCGKWGDEGFLVLDTFTTDRNGNARLNRISHPLPEGIYRVKFLIAENSPPWTVPLMEEEPMKFIVINS